MDETLLEKIAANTGLPKELVINEIKEWAWAEGKNPQTLSLEDFREIMVKLLQNLFNDVADGKNPHIKL